jgi:hypothetical protein
MCRYTIPELPFVPEFHTCTYEYSIYYIHSSSSILLTVHPRFAFKKHCHFEHCVQQNDEILHAPCFLSESLPEHVRRNQSYYCRPIDGWALQLVLRFHGCSKLLSTARTDGSVQTPLIKIKIKYTG